MYEDDRGVRRLDVGDVQRLQKEQAAHNQCSAPSAQDRQPSGLGQLGGYKVGESIYRNSIRHRVERTIAEFETSIKRAGAAQRVKEIIDQHPEFAELLDLLTEIFDLLTEI